MSLNTIELGDLIVSELYPNSLLATEAALPTAARPTVAKVPIGPDLSSGSAPATTARPDSETSLPTKPVARTTAIPETKSPQPDSSDLKQPAVPGTNQPTAPVAGPTTTIPTGAAPVARTSSTSSPDGSYKFLGNNRRQITVLVQSPGVAFLPDDQLSFLTRMLEACKMNVGDVAIVNLANAAVSITALKQQLQPKMILLFGMEPVAIRLPMNFPWFKIQTYDECTFLCAPSLEELVLPGDESKLLKSKLWMCLKTLFGI